ARGSVDAPRQDRRRGPGPEGAAERGKAGARRAPALREDRRAPQRGGLRRRRGADLRPRRALREDLLGRAPLPRRARGVGAGAGGRRPPPPHPPLSSTPPRSPSKSRSQRLLASPPA